MEIGETRLRHIFKHSTVGQTAIYNLCLIRPPSQSQKPVFRTEICKLSLSVCPYSKFAFIKCEITGGDSDKAKALTNGACQ